MSFDNCDIYLYVNKNNQWQTIIAHRRLLVMIIYKVMYYLSLFFGLSFSTAHNIIVICTAVS